MSLSGYKNSMIKAYPMHEFVNKLGCVYHINTLCNNSKA